MARASQRLAGWQHLINAASSSDRVNQHYAIVRAYAWVEHALNAAGVPDPKKPIATRILRALNIANLSSGLNEACVRAAIQIRHELSHDDAIPDAVRCSSAVCTFHEIWHALSRHFVNKATATAIGNKLLTQEGILCVLLYGSLARSDPEPNDIDLLVMDDGRYAPQCSPRAYSDGTFDTFEITMETLALLRCDEPKLRLSARCRWLDVSLLDGVRFGHDRDYTEKVRKAQPDPWFFLNISADLKELDGKQCEFVDADRPPFGQLRRLLNSLHELGFG